MPNPIPTPKERPYTIEEAAELLHCPPEAVWFALENGQLTACALADYTYEDDGTAGFDSVRLPPEVVRRIHAGTQDTIVFKPYMPYSEMSARVQSRQELVRVLLIPELFPDLLRKMDESGHHTPEAPNVEAAEHPYRSKKLAILNQAATRFWGNADPNDKGTHPNNSDVVAWLVLNRFTETLAEKGATIIRPDWAFTGRKPEE